jgi:quercetin dioxygenase-like cupin family protein
MTRRIVAILGFALAMVVVVGLVSRREGISSRIRLVQQKLSGDLVGVNWTELAIRMAPGAVHTELRRLLMPGLPHWWKKLERPSGEEKPWRMAFAFEGPTTCLAKLDCHVSVLQHGKTPHDLHQHDDEEIIIPLSGTVDILSASDIDSSEPQVETIQRGQFIYHAPRRPHTIRAAGDGEATYLILRWEGELADRSPLLPSSVFSMSEIPPPDGAARGFSTELIFESPTPHLEKLHCHQSTIAPGGGYDAHADNYDVVIVVLEGVVETLGEQIGADSVIFYSANRPHGMRNPGTSPARYLPFEFHSDAASDH